MRASEIGRTHSTRAKLRRQVSYQPDSAEPIHIGRRRVGQPRQQWLFRSNVVP